MQRRRARAIGIGLAALAGLAALLLALYVFALPAYLASRVRGALAARGVERVEFEVHPLPFRGMELREVRIGEEEVIAAERIRILYGPRDLLAGEISGVEVVGGAWKLAVRDGAPELGPFEPRPGEPVELPFERVQLEASEALVNWEGREVAVPISGSLSRRGAAALAFDLDVVLAGEEVRAAGELELERGALAVRARSPAGWAELRRAPGEATSISFEVERDRLALEAGETPVVARGVSASGAVELAGRRVRGAEAELSVERASVGGRDLGAIDLSVSGGEGAVVGRAVAAYPGGGELSLTAVASPELEAWGRAPLALWWSASGPLPPELLQALSARGLAVSAPEALVFRGIGTAIPAERALEIAGASLSLGAERIEAPAAQLELAGVRADLAMSGRLDPDGADLLLLPGSVARARRVEAERRLRLDRATARFGLRLQAGPDAVRVSALSGALLGARRLLLRGAGRRLVLGRPSLRLVASETPIFTATRGDGDRFDLRSALALVSTRPARVRGAAVGRLDRVRLELEARAAAGADLELGARLRARAGELAVPASELALDSVAASVSVGAGARARVRVGRVRWRGRSVASDARARLSPEGRGYAVEGSARVAGGRRARARGALRFGAAGPRGRIEWELPPVELAALAPAQELAGAAGVRLGGRLSARGRLTLGAERAARGELFLDGVSLGGAEGGWSVSGITGDLGFASLAPMATAGPQTLSWEALSIGEVKLGGGKVTARLAPAGGLFVERLELATRPGRIWASDFRIDPGGRRIEVEIFARDLSLRRWLPIVSRGRATGEGRLSGRIPVALQVEPQWKLRFGEGYLRAEGPGTIRLRDRAQLTALLERHAPGFVSGERYSEQIQQRVVAALSDFAYEELKLSIVEEGGGRTLRIEISGKGRKVPQELHLTVNVSGFEELLNPMLRLWRRSAGELASAARRSSCVQCR